MFITLVTYLIPAIQILLPLYLVYRSWTTEYAIQLTWFFNISHAVLAMLVLFFVFRWDLVGYSLRYWLYGGYLLALGISYVNVKELPFYEASKFTLKWGQLTEILLFVCGIIWAFAGFETGRKAVDVAYPLNGDSYYVVHGGSTAILNYHGIFAEQQKYAIDINQLNGWGLRAGGVLPEKLDSYAVFGDTVYSPVSGKVIQKRESLNDRTPPSSQSSKPAGNHIWIKRDSLYVVLAHLKHESIRVEEGEKVQVHQPLARVGNSGNTTEPHLHIHAVTFPGNEIPPEDSLLYGGQPIPLTFKGTFITRNSTF